MEWLKQNWHWIFVLIYILILLYAMYLIGGIAACQNTGGQMDDTHTCIITQEQFDKYLMDKAIKRIPLKNELRGKLS